MVGVAFDCLSNPLGAVRVTFEKAIASGIDPKSLNGKDWGAIEAFRDSLSDHQVFSQVPILDHSSIGWIQPNSLVRFRGMVQDMLGNEFYVGAYKDGSKWRTNKFTDVASFPMGSESERSIWERQLLYCVPHSSQSVVTSCNYSSSQHGEKRQREDAMVEDHMVHQELQGSTSSSKKMREGGVSGQSSQLQESVTDETSGKVCAIPDFDSKDLSCLVKLYDSPESDYKLNDIIEFVGVFTFNPELMAQGDGSADLSNELFEDALAHLPPNKVQRLHCVVHRKLANHDFLLGSSVIEIMPNLVRNTREALLGYLTTVLGNDGLAAECVLLHLLSRVQRLHCVVHRKLANHDFLLGSSVIEIMPNLVRNTREALLGYLTTVLGNDGLAAECVLLHLLSRVHARVDSAALGKLSLNLTGFTTESYSVFGSQLKNAVQTLLPFTKSVPFNVEYLNSVSLAPKKDYETNRLVSGTLQLAEGTHLTLDETQLKAGMLNSVGVENARLLNNLVELQKVEYDFQFFKMEMPTDVQVLILSEGKSNILPADLVLPFQPSAVGSFVNAETEALQSWRWYLATLRLSTHDMDPDMQKVIEEDLVAARQEDRSLGSKDFSRWLTMARLMSASFGETRLTMEHWQMAKELERRRKERLNGMKKMSGF
ncbi:Mini-chromosome maintenance complex-binding protein [Thalictrum thalictroides]|uniref:Mini-chromosome maintenance complex-binding protein n=1 Tax=Thalictrum thalictroides TaxID=46969 RepID=A0A7J6XA08_THATH|nr:Mini-chromosome maintenance complex-binding protein [Thalictrum thalictroides]